jgi:hypothetical protein
MAVEPARGRVTRESFNAKAEELRKFIFEVKDVAREAARVAREEAPTPIPPWIKVDQVRAALPSDAVLIDVVTHADYDFDAPPGSLTFNGGRNIAFVIPPAGNGDVRLVDLGDEEIVWEVINAYLLQIGSPEDDDTASHREANAVARRVSRDVARVILDPLYPHVRDAKRWVVSPASLSWLVPWAALVLEDGSLAVEHHAISYILTGRHLVPETTAWAASGTELAAPLILADPDYDLGLPPNRKGRGPFLPLPGTVEEAEAIAPHLEAWTKTKPRILLGAETTERALRTTGPPSVLVAGTHGYYGQLPGVLLGVHSPMLRCGLALAGANPRTLAHDLPGDDGVATGLEILAADFRGTDLVVLSACQTSFGEFQTMQGLVGLSLAFHLAGATNVLGTLWPVPDDETTAITTEFFAGLARGASKDLALQKAQLDLIEKLRAKYGDAHPSLWASFQLSGNVFLPKP